MNRRHFLLLRTHAHAELSCERLYMRLLDAQLAGRDFADNASEGESERGPVFSASAPAMLFDRLARDLEHVDVLTVIDPAWLHHDGLRARLDPVLTAFRARGGVVRGLVSL